jgi:hypothetical protein
MNPEYYRPTKNRLDRLAREAAAQEAREAAAREAALIRLAPVPRKKPVSTASKILKVLKVLWMFVSGLYLVMLYQTVIGLTYAISCLGGAYVMHFLIGGLGNWTWLISIVFGYVCAVFAFSRLKIG